MYLHDITSNIRLHYVEIQVHILRFCLFAFWISVFPSSEKKIYLEVQCWKLLNRFIHAYPHRTRCESVDGLRRNVHRPPNEFAQI